MANSYGVNLPAASNRGYLATAGELEQWGAGKAEAQELRDKMLEREYGGGMTRAELQDFDTLIGRLEGSKMRQASQSNRARQRDTFAGGLASMMGNF